MSTKVFWTSLAVLQLVVAYPRQGVKTGRSISCKKYIEYPHNGICCVNCEAGQYVQSPCTETGKKGTCEECDYGTFTEHANGLKQCIKCTQCPPDQEIVRVCSHTHDTLCQCKPGRYCHPDEACEICRKCSRCNSDEEVVKNCTSTSNTECKKRQGNFSPEAAPTLTTGLTVFFVVLVIVLVIIILIFWEKKWRREDSNNFNQCLQGCISVRKPHSTSPSTYANMYPQRKEEIINLCESNSSSARSSQHNLTDPAETLPCEDPNRREEEPFPTLIPKNGVESLLACFEFFEELNVDFHHRFFRKLSVENNEIRSKDHLSYEDRIHYLLSYWVEKKGKEANLNHLLRALLDLNQRRTAEEIMNKAIEKGYFEFESSSMGDD
ncbi:hematopoietic death receptor [Gambusia affinis]|uniref:hematopoietic death receptor n=1 Tax=Gambusia affinis TaxID=33528 RepID=UPI001CDC512B|nr:hematopoietic death receptor [Gambusia affinis]